MSADPTAVLHRVEEIENYVEFCSDIDKIPVYKMAQHVFWLCSQLRSALQDTQRRVWLRQNVCAITTRDGDGVEVVHEEEGEDDGIIDVIDRLASTREARP